MKNKTRRARGFWDAGGKLKKAQTLGVKILDEEEFLKLAAQ